MGPNSQLVAGYLDFARYDKGTLQFNCASYIRYRGRERLQFFHSPDNRVRVFQAVSGDRANKPAAFWNLLKPICCAA